MFPASCSPEWRRCGRDKSGFYFQGDIAHLMQDSGLKVIDHLGENFPWFLHHSSGCLAQPLSITLHLRLIASCLCFPSLYNSQTGCLSWEHLWMFNLKFLKFLFNFIIIFYFAHYCFILKNLEFFYVTTLRALIGSLKYCFQFYILGFWRGMWIWVLTRIKPTPLHWRLWSL